MSDQTPYGQPSGPPDPDGRPTGQPSPYGHEPYGQQPYRQQPYGSEPYGQQPYGPGPGEDRRPGTVTAAGWITIVFSAIVAVIFGFTTVGLVVARDQLITEIEKVPEFQDANIDPDAAVGVLVALMLGLVVWAIIAIVLAVLVLRRSNVARILLVISCVVTALLSLLAITSGVTLVLLIASVATIVLLFTGGAGDWFRRLTAHNGHGGPAAFGEYGRPSADTPQQPSPYGNPYGAQPGQGAGPQYPPPSENPYGQRPPSDDDRPPSDHPGR